MQSFKQFAKSARQNYVMGKYEDAIEDYNEAINILSYHIQQLSGTGQNEKRNRYVRCLNVMQYEMKSIKTKLLPKMYQLSVIFYEHLNTESESPPADPPNALSRRAANLPSHPAGINNNVRHNSSGRLSLQQAPNKRTKLATPSSNATRSATFTKARIKKVNGNNTETTVTNTKSKGVESNDTSNNIDSSESYASLSIPDNVNRQPFDFVGYDQSMVSLIQNGILQQTPSIHWKDVSGLEDAKMLLTEAVILPMERPDLFRGIRRPWRGICMFGPPGTGKTLLAKAVANECNTTFFNVSSAILTSKYHGDSEKLVRLLFEIARYRAPSTIFIDEIDSICSRRGNEKEHEASRRAKSELLIQMDGCTTDDGKTVLVLAATNFPWDLDDALRRRLEKRIYIPLPDKEARLNLLNNALEGVELDNDVNLVDIADRLDGYSGSDITGICRDAAMAPMRERLRSTNVLGDCEARRKALEGEPDLTIRMDHFETAMRNIMPSVSQNEVQRYMQWMEEFGSK